MPLFRHAFAATIAAAAIAGLPLVPAPAHAAPPAEVVVQFAPGVDAAAFAAAQGLALLDQFGSRPIWRLGLTAPGDPDAVAAALAVLPEVVFAEANSEGETPESVRASVWLIGNTAEDYAGQWAPDALRLTEAHALATGLGVRIAVLDTGVELTHPSLAGQLLRRRDGRLVGRDFVDADADPSEEGGPGDLGWGHGTHVAGLLALAAPGAKLMPVRVLDTRGRGNIWVLAEGLLWAVDPDGRPRSDDGAHVINLSLGTTRPTRLLDLAVKLAACTFDDDDDDEGLDGPGFAADRERCARGHAALVVASAGNGGSDSELIYPAAEGVEGARAIAATRPDGALAGFSNRGGWIPLAAPGESIVSSVPGGGAAGAWGTWSGTSMAAPLAAGTAALVLSSRAPGQWRPNPRRWTPEDALKRLEDRAAPVCGASQRAIDAFAAVTDTAPPDPACP
jgi:subtilisin family serine protease